MIINSRLARTVTLFLFLLTIASWAQVDLDKVVAVEQSVEKDSFRLVLQTDKRAPQASAYFLSGPDRLVVDLTDATVAAELPSEPFHPMIRSWSLTQNTLNRARLTVVLNYRPSVSEIKMESNPSERRVVVEIPTDSGFQEEMAITPGITWHRNDTFMAGRWVRQCRLYFDPLDPEIEVILGLANEKIDAREKLSSMVERYGAVAGINGGFFDAHAGALGLVYKDGKMLAPHVSRRPPRSAFGLTRDGRALFGRLAANGQRITDLDGGDWSKAWMALGCGPRLMQDGVARITADLEELGRKGNDITRVAARTAVGQTHSGQLLFATVSGYHDNHREGVQFEPLVEWLKELGVKNAVNYDGGASVDMVIGSHIVSDGPANTTQEKPVATALLVKDSRPTLFPEKVEWQIANSTMPADGKSTQEISVRLQKASGEAVPDGTEVRFFGYGMQVEPALTKTSGGVARTTVRSARNSGKARLSVFAGPLSDRQEITMVPGELERFMIVESSAKKNTKKPNTQTVTLKVLATDAWGNSLPSVPFETTIDGAAGPDLVTDAGGVTTLEVDLPNTGGEFTIQHQRAKATHRVAPLTISP